MRAKASEGKKEWIKFNDCDLSIEKSWYDAVYSIVFAADIPTMVIYEKR